MTFQVSFHKLILKGWRCSTKFNNMPSEDIVYAGKITNRTFTLSLHVSSVCLCVHQRPDEEVVVDQGGTSSVLNIHYEKEELEGE